MAKAGQRNVEHKSDLTKQRAPKVAQGGKTRAGNIRSGRSGSDSNSSSGTRGR